VLASCVACAALGGVRNAVAISCWPGEELSLPRDGDRDVPLNALIWGGWPTRVVLRGPDGVVAGERRRIPAPGGAQEGPGFPVFIPDEPLLPNTVYTVEEGDRPRTRQFTTGDAIDDEAPAPVVLVNRSEAPGSLTLDFAADDILAGELSAVSAPFTSIEDVLLPVNFDGYRAIDAEEPVFEWLQPEPTLRLLVGGFCANWRAPVYTPEARFGTFDLAGNFSGWTDVPDLEVPPVPPVSEVSEPLDDGFTPPTPSTERAQGCSVGAATSASTASRWAGLLAVLMGLGLRAFFDAPASQVARGASRRRGCVVSRRAR
jgi:hypothetical protein